MGELVTRRLSNPGSPARRFSGSCMNRHEYLRSSFLFIWPPTHFVRSTDADGRRNFASATRLRTRLRPGRPAEAKTSIASRYYQCLCLKGMKLLPGQACPVVAFRRSRIAQAKSFYCLRIVCVCLRLKYLLIYRIQRGSSAPSIKFHQLFRR
jgi:hypothetical protein